MDNSVSTSILDSPNPFTASTSPSFLDRLKQISLFTWILIIIGLCFLGVNVFLYLGKGTQEVTDLLAPFMKKFAAITGQTVDVAAEGGKAVVGGTAAVATAGLNTVQDITPNAAPTSGQSVQAQPQPGGPPPDPQSAALHKALASSPSENDYQANEATSTVQGTKAGWCFVGEDRGYRSCAEVGVNDTCMSGDIFPTQELCIHPNLRA
jgi:hypothetical protein